MKQLSLTSSFYAEIFRDAAKFLETRLYRSSDSRFKKNLLQKFVVNCRFQSLTDAIMLSLSGYNCNWELKCNFRYLWSKLSAKIANVETPTESVWKGPNKIIKTFSNKWIWLLVVSMLVAITHWKQLHNFRLVTVYPRAQPGKGGKGTEAPPLDKSNIKISDSLDLFCVSMTWSCVIWPIYNLKNDYGSMAQQNFKKSHKTS